MKTQLDETLLWIETQQQSMLKHLRTWSEINSGTDHLEGLNHQLHAIKPLLDEIADSVEICPLPPSEIVNDQGEKILKPHGNALRAQKRASAKKILFLGGHMDTVFSESHPFQKTSLIPSENKLVGPGVADMKGGLLVMLTALKAFEKMDVSKNIGWEVVINPDEETGSVGSLNLLEDSASRCQYALIFEPAFPDGSFVDARKGSLNLAVIAKGKEAHAGRDFDKGTSAIATLAKFIVQAEKFNDPEKNITINFGKIIGGGPINIVPALAICHINARALSISDFESLETSFTHLSKTFHGAIEISVLSSRVPKPFDTKAKIFFDMLKECTEEEKIPFKHVMSGGVCDGNIFSSQGIPTIDTLGVIGGHLHTSSEYMLIDSLVSKAKLTLRLLTKLATTTTGTK